MVPFDDVIMTVATTVPVDGPATLGPGRDDQGLTLLTVKAFNKKLLAEKLGCEWLRL